MMAMQISLEAESLTIQWADDKVSVFPYLWLRDTDPAGFDNRRLLHGREAFEPGSGQRDCRLRILSTPRL